MTESNYRKLIVWQKARELAKGVYRETQCFPRAEIFGLTQQMQRAAISILSNIAEGQGRYTRRDCRRFLVIARGSATELEAQIVIASDLEFLSPKAASDLENRATEVCRMLNGLMKRFPET
ncbi:MAG TPA: four helix bundle protein [Thermoanaerobaculia bacterium]|jgi:four helix bundle protein